jgi:hypothetical protein
MQLLKQKAARWASIRSATRKSKTDGVVTRIKIDEKVNVATSDGWLCFWVAGREVRIGPLTPEQAEHLADDLAYDAVV